MDRFPRRVPATRSNTSVCLKVVDPEVTALPAEAQAAFAKALASALEKEKVAFDIGAYRDAPPGLRIWCGATVEKADVEALTQWLDWAFARRKPSSPRRPNALLPRRGRRRPASAGRMRVTLVRAASRPRAPLPHLPSSGGLRPPPRASPALSRKGEGFCEARNTSHGPSRSHLRQLSPAAVAIFKERGVEVDVKPGLDKDELAEIIGDYDGLAIRSATKVTAKLLEHAKKLKVVGRAGIGVDNVDIPAATARGVIVMNTPFGNSITTAEHAIALMFALARELPAADASTQAGKWEKNRFMGVELTGKTLGIIGCGNIGSIVASRALGLKMRVIAFDPFLARSAPPRSASRRSSSTSCWRAPTSSRCTRR